MAAAKSSGVGSAGMSLEASGPTHSFSAPKQCWSLHERHSGLNIFFRQAAAHFLKAQIAFKAKHDVQSCESRKSRDAFVIKLASVLSSPLNFDASRDFFVELRVENLSILMEKSAAFQSVTSSAVHIALTDATKRVINPKTVLNIVNY